MLKKNLPMFRKLFGILTKKPPLEIAFLLGSGVSIPAGMPTTQQITECVLSGLGKTLGHGVARHHSDGTYYYHYTEETLIGKDEYVPRILILLNRLKAEIDVYYFQSGHSANYEDLYYLVSQIEDSLTGNYDNPAVQPFIDKVFSDIKKVLEGKQGEIRNKWAMEELASEARAYIHDVVAVLLRRSPKHTDHLNGIKDAYGDAQLSGIDIFTLNHDTVLEQVLSKSGIQVIDGFGEPVKGVRYWNPDLFGSTVSGMRIFKLHGSVNWFRFGQEGGQWGSELVGIPLEWDIWHQKDPQGQTQLPVDGRPMILAGTFNKMLQYTSDIYAHLHYQFHHSLQNIERLVISGYSFGDKGINSQIIEWNYSRPDRKILIIHHDPGKLKRTARYAISKHIEEWIRLGKMAVINRKIEGVSWSEIKANLLPA